MTKTNARRAVRRYIAEYIRIHGIALPHGNFADEVINEWVPESQRIADRIERGDLVQGHRLRLE